jgi:hypothetical protein
VRERGGGRRSEEEGGGEEYKPLVNSLPHMETESFSFQR